MMELTGHMFNRPVMCSLLLVKFIIISLVLNFNQRKTEE